MMAIRDGDVVVRPSTGQRVRWRPIEPVADEYDAARLLLWVILGVIGNLAHLRKSGGHTPWCSELGAKPGWVYAIDIAVPEDVAPALEKWLLARLRAGYYPWVGYFNLLNRHWSREAIKTSGDKAVRWAYSVYSGDHHLHLSGRGGYETTNSSILRDFDAWRRAGSPAQISTPPTQEGELSEAYEKRSGAQLDAIYDAVVGGTGTAYDRSRMRIDHGYQIDEVERRVTAHVDAQLADLRSDLAAKLARIEALVNPAPPAGA